MGGGLFIHPARLLVGQARLNDTVGQATAGCYSRSIPPGLIEHHLFLSITFLVFTTPKPVPMGKELKENNNR
ncbi:hypothetical protein KJ656_01490 [bacterium]|nr:hypothetical protein [bacterium]